MTSAEVTGLTAVTKIIPKKKPTKTGIVIIDILENPELFKITISSVFVNLKKSQIEAKSIMKGKKLKIKFGIINKVKRMGKYKQRICYSSNRSS